MGNGGGRRRQHVCNFGPPDLCNLRPPLTVSAALSRLGLLNRLSVSPETHTAAQMIRLVKALITRGAGVINMFFHSPSLLEGCGPFVQTVDDLEPFITRIERVLEFVRSAGLQPRTMSEIANAPGFADRYQSVTVPGVE